MWSEGQFSVGVILEKEQLQLMCRSRVQLWEQNTGIEWGWLLEHKELEDLNGQWLNGSQRKTMRQMLKSSMPEEG